MKILNKLILLSTLVLFGCGPLHEDEGRYLLENFGDSIVMLTAPSNNSGGGTGFAVQTATGRVYTATNAHVCGLAENNKMRAYYNDDTYSDLEILKISEESDLCLLEAAPKAKVLRLASGINKYGRVNVLGHPLLRRLSYSSGYIVNRDVFDILYGKPENCDLNMPKFHVKDVEVFFGLAKTPMCVESIDSYDTTVPTYPGNSGSPALDDEGNIVGVVFAGDGDTHWGLIIPLDVFEHFLIGY